MIGWLNDYLTGRRGVAALLALFLGSMIIASCAVSGLPSLEQQVYVSCRAYVTGLRAVALQRPRLNDAQVASVQAVVDHVGPVCRNAAEGKLDYSRDVLLDIINSIIEFRQRKLIKDAVAERDVQ